MACEVLLEGGELEVLREVLAVFPEQAATTPEDIMVQTLKLLLGQWRTGAQQVCVEVEGKGSPGSVDVAVWVKCFCFCCFVFVC